MSHSYRECSVLPWVFDNSDYFSCTYDGAPSYVIPQNCARKEINQITQSHHIAMHKYILMF